MYYQAVLSATLHVSVSAEHEAMLFISDMKLVLSFRTTSELFGKWTLVIAWKWCSILMWRARDKCFLTSYWFVVLFRRTRLLSTRQEMSS